jgi:hypothetical protein
MDVHYRSQRGRKFSNEQINQIRNIYNSFGSISGKKIARMFNTNGPMISMIGTLKIYKDVLFTKIEKEELCNLIQTLSRRYPLTLEA